jgi:hypothetical protein
MTQDSGTPPTRLKAPAPFQGEQDPEPRDPVADLQAAIEAQWNPPARPDGHAHIWVGERSLLMARVAFPNAVLVRLDGPLVWP